MKNCPKCGNRYTDSTLMFCLTDGTALVSSEKEAVTEVLSVPTLSFEQDSENPQETNRQFSAETTTIQRKGVSPFWIVATFGLLVLLVTGVGVIWLASNGYFDRGADKTADSSNRDLGPAQTAGVANASSPNSEKKTNTYRVSGVASNDVLNMRPSPGNLKVVVGKIPPNGKGITIAGGSKRVGKSRWILVRYKGKKGWINSKYIRKE